MAFTELRDATTNLLISFGAPPEWFTDFDFVVGETPLSETHIPMITVTLYCIGIPVLQSFMKNRQPPPLKWILVVHNIFLFVVSAFFAFYLTVSVLSYTENDSLFNQFGYYRRLCSLNVFENRTCLTWIYYCNHMLKYYELLDTIFLALKKKPIGFLHAYHHPATLVLTWAQLVDATGVQWYVIVLNLYVHTIMYFYYAMAALKIRIPFKQSVTICQILQFVLDLLWVYSTWFRVSFYQECQGTGRAAINGCFVLTSYLFLFVDFYNETYNSKPSKEKSS